MNTKRRRKRLRPVSYRNIVHDPKGRPLGVEVKFQLICDCRTKFAYLARDRCPVCHKRIVALNQPKYLVYTYYFSTYDRRDPERIARVIEEKKIDEFVIENIAKRIKISPQLRDWVLRHLNELEDAELAERNRETQTLDDFKEQYATKRRRLRELYVSEYISEEEFKADLAELEEVHHERMEQASQRETVTTDLEKILNLAVELENVITHGDPEAKNQALRDLHSNLTWDGESLCICNAKPVNALMEMLESARQLNPTFEPGKCVDISTRNDVFMSVRPILWRGIHSIRT